MKVIRPPRRHLASGLAWFLLVPLAVVTAGVFSRHVWWDLPIGSLQLAGWVALAIAAPASWRLIMGRAGTWRGLAAICVLACAALLLRATWLAGTLQAIWAVLLTAVCTGLLAWSRWELGQSYFDPQLQWFQGLPRAIPGVSCVALPTGRNAQAFRVCRLDEDGAFVFSDQGALPAQAEIQLELRHQDRKIRMSGIIVRQFEDRSPRGWGVGVRWASQEPDAAKEFRDFLEVIRVEGGIS